MKEIEELKHKIKQLEDELTFLKTHPAIMQGIKGETLVASLTGGEITTYASEHDIEINGKVTIEVKYSKLNTPVKNSKTRRWNWSKILGWKDKGKNFDFILLIGEKDPRFTEQYLDTSPYVYFLIPKEKVQTILSQGTIGSQAQINTNLNTARSEMSQIIKRYMVKESILSGELMSE